MTLFSKSFQGPPDDYSIKTFRPYDNFLYNHKVFQYATHIIIFVKLKNTIITPYVGTLKCEKYCLIKCGHSQLFVHTDYGKLSKISNNGCHNNFFYICTFFKYFGKSNTTSKGLCQKQNNRGYFITVSFWEILHSKSGHTAFLEEKVLVFKTSLDEAFN